MVDIEGLVQHPPMRPFQMRDIERHLTFGARQVKHDRNHDVVHCYVLAIRILYFIMGIHSKSEEMQCVDRESNKDHKCR